MADFKNEVRVRFAPSPTGHLHVGSVRVAIFNWLFARHNNGKYLVRIEDTDQVRSKKEYVEFQLKSLKWLGLLSDESVLYQLSRIEEHKKIAKDFLEKGLAYPCFCQPSAVAAEPKKVEEFYVEQEQCNCKDKKYSEQDLQKPYAIRFRVPRDQKRIEFEDVIRGKISVDIDQINDFIILRQDGIPTYNFVVVLDDIFMKISHVIRGEDHISNTPKQIFIYKALNEKLPVFAHLPLILGPSGHRLSKRDAAVSVDEYRVQGFLPDALFNYLVRLGWSHGDQEIFTKDEMIKHFSLDNVGKKGAIFDIKKLEWLNGVYIRKLDFEGFIKAVENIENNYKEELIKFWEKEQLEELFTQYGARAIRILNMVQDIISFAKSPKVLDLNLIKKWLSKKSIGLMQSYENNISSLKKFDGSILRQAQDDRHAYGALTTSELNKIAKDVCKEVDMKLVALAQPLRLALTGKIMSPGVFELMTILGKEKSLERISFLIKMLQENLDLFK
ncbi:glutamate--tRNA ligase [Candidatus Babeliales bacterium]|nr:glutamate--tRNA ligase [Candidatus Babeliales bacterium]